MILRALLVAAWVALVAVGGGAATADELPAIGDPAGDALSPEQERRLGEVIMRQVRQRLPLVEDPELRGYVESLGDRIVGASDRPQQGFDFFLVQDPMINAFALPGGFVGVHTGLMLASRSESELAAVVAHEVAHVTQRHIARTYQAAGRHNLAAIAAVLVAMALGAENAELGQAALATGAAASAQAQVNFTRANEKEADRIGIQILARADFDPDAMASFFERLHERTRYYGNRLPEFLSTHPVTASRIAEARTRATDYRGSGRHEGLTYYLMRAKLRVMTADDPAEVRQAFEAALERQGEADDTGPAVAQRYGKVLALLAEGQATAARDASRALIEEAGERLAFQLALARATAAAEGPEAALAVYEATQKLYPGDRALATYHGEALLRAGRAEQARQMLNRQLQRYGPDAHLYELLARAAGDAGHPARAHEAMAEHYRLLGETRAAIEQLQLALRLAADDYYQSSRIEARLGELKRRAELEKSLELP